MTTKKCNHDYKDWTNFVGAGHNQPSIYKCDKCGRLIYASELFQYELLKHELGFRKWLSVIAIIVSFASLVVAICVAVWK